MAKFTRKAIERGATKRLQEMSKIARQASNYLNRVAYPKYQQHQARRWATENFGEWPALDPDYAESKLTRFAECPGAGKHMMIATGTLISSVIGSTNKTNYIGDPAGISHHRKLVKDTFMRISTTVPYAEEANEEREFIKFPKWFTNELKRELVEYVMGKTR